MPGKKIARKRPGSRCEADLALRTARALPPPFLLWLVAYCTFSTPPYRTVDTVKQSQRRVTSPTSKMFRQHLKCSLTAGRAGASLGFFFVSFYSASCLSLGDLVQRCLGQPVDLLAPWPSAAVIPRRRSTAVHFQSVERRVQRNVEG